LSDHRDKAIAYFQLDDFDKSIKFYEKDIKERSKNISHLNIFKPQLEIIEQAAYMYEQQNILIFLPKLFHSLIKKILKTDTLEVSDILVLADSYFQCAVIYEQSSSYLKSVAAYISAFGLYVSKSTSEIDKLIDDVNNLLNSFIECSLKSEKIIEICEQHLPSDEIIHIRLKIAAMYRDDKIDDVEDTDGDDDTSNQSRIIALEQYKTLLDITNDVSLKGVCYYNILSLYKDCIREDDSGKTIVNGMINCLPKFTNSDRRLLIELAFHFLKEYDNNKDSCDKKSYDQLHKIAKIYSGEKWKVDDKSTIGYYLMESKDLVRAEDYWNSIAEQLECDIPNKILSLVHDPDSTFDQILHTIEQPENDTISLLYQLTYTYETLGDYYKSDATTGQRTDIECFRQAESMYKKAVHLLKRLKAETDTINKVEKKQQEAASQANK
jgi:tetratricopeptide (TPR) repeat protein